MSTVTTALEEVLACPPCRPRRDFGGSRRCGLSIPADLGAPKYSAYRVTNVNADTLDVTFRALRELSGAPLNVGDLLGWTNLNKNSGLCLKQGSSALCYRVTRPTDIRKWRYRSGKKA